MPQSFCWTMTGLWAAALWWPGACALPLVARRDACTGHATWTLGTAVAACPVPLLAGV